jgi:arginase
MRDIDERGLRAVMAEAIHIASQGTAGFHLSLDMDVVDPDEAPGVGTPVRGGITYREAHLAMELAGESGGMVSMEVVEVNPVLDVANRTAELAVELVMSALGKRIL